MVRKRKKAEETLKPWCYYCDRVFNDEATLIQHQRAKHFKCPTCAKKLTTAQGLSVHCMQVHKKTLDGVPFAKPGKNDPSLEIFGMSGVPAGIQPGVALEDESEVDAAQSSIGPAGSLTAPVASIPVPAPVPAYVPPIVPPPGLYPPTAAYNPPPYPGYAYAPPPFPGAPAVPGYPSLPPRPLVPLPVHPGGPPGMPMPGGPLPMGPPISVPPSFAPGVPPAARPPLFPIGVPGGVPGIQGAPVPAAAPAQAPLFPIGQAPPATAPGQQGPPGMYSEAPPGYAAPPGQPGQSRPPLQALPGQVGPPPLFPIQAAGLGAPAQPAPHAQSQGGGPFVPGAALDNHSGEGVRNHNVAPASVPDGDLVWTDPDVSQEEVRSLSPKYKAFVSQGPDSGIPAGPAAPPRQPALGLPSPQGGNHGTPFPHIPQGQAPQAFYNQPLR
eukprot:jgi/Botrbrau1/14775/Bobra.0284s0009.2